MVVFRIARKKYISELTGLGAKLYGGRWNRPGIAVVYTSETRALATVEFLVHLAWPQLPPGMQMATLKIPDGVIPEFLSPERLPKNWRNYPPPNKLAWLGDEWARSKRSLALRVPSAVIDQEFNILVNPNHPEIHHVSIVKVEELKIDRRLVVRNGRH